MKTDSALLLLSGPAAVVRTVAAVALGSQLALAHSTDIHHAGHVRHKNRTHAHCAYLAQICLIIFIVTHF